MASHPIYQFYAELSEFTPKIWRRFQVMNHITVARLGYIIMTLFEMQANHLFVFDVPVEENYRKCVGGDNVNQQVMDIFAENPELERMRIELFNEDSFSEFGKYTLDAAKTKVKNILTERTETLAFSYDFGDGWEIDLVLEEIIEDKELPGKELPRVLAGGGYGIIEDYGGPDGLEDLIKVFKKKQCLQYQQYCERLGVRDLDLSYFDLDDMNFRLKKVPRIYTDIYEYGLEPTEQSMALLMREYKK